MIIVNRIIFDYYKLTGLKTDYRKIEEFDKADIQMKTIPINRNGAPIEEMSFKQIDFIGIINEDWENSYWHDALTKKFFFVVFEEFENKSYLKKVFFWTMPYDDLLLAKNSGKTPRKKSKTMISKIS